MIRKCILAASLLCAGPAMLFAQNKLTIENVQSAYLRNSGSIMENNQIKGYFFLYQSDKIDKNTNEYTLQILDQNLNKVKDIKFQDSKKVYLLEASYNGSSLAFFFKNEDTKTLDMKIYSLDGKLKYTYSREYDKKTDALMDQYTTLRTDEGTNQNVFDLGEQGYASVMPLRDGKQRTYEVDYYSSEKKTQWTYVPTDDEERYANAEFLGSTDSLIIIEVMKKRRALSGKVGASLIGINFVTKKKEFEIDAEETQYKFLPTSIAKMPGTGSFLVMGSYFKENADVSKDASLGLALYEISTKGKILTKSYNSWGEDFSKYLPTNSKGKIDDIGFLYIHKLIKAPNGKLFVVGEGYKRKASALGIGMTVLSGGRNSYAGVTKMVITDMVIMEFNDKYKITHADIFEKKQNNAELWAISDQNSQHALAMMLRTWGYFDYEFTTGEPDNSTFNICYSDYVRGSDYKGRTFNAIRYNGTKFNTERIELESKAKYMKVLPAKAGSVMILEYFKKDRKLELRIEKLG